MANKVFISFRFSDGSDHKDLLVKTFDELDYVINKSEDVDRTGASEQTIQNFLYEKLRDTSLTIVILTPEAVNYRRNWYGGIDDWLYDELRYSLEDRSYNRTKAVIALYTEDVENTLYSFGNYCDDCGEQHKNINDFENLIRKNMFNVKNQYKSCSCSGYDSLKDHYISLIKFSEFLDNPKKYIDNALDKRSRIHNFDISKRM